MTIMPFVGRKKKKKLLLEEQKRERALSLDSNADINDDILSKIGNGEFVERGQWVPDINVTKCMTPVCSLKFGIFRRRHHWYG